MINKANTYPADFFRGCVICKERKLKIKFKMNDMNFSSILYLHSNNNSCLKQFYITR